MKKFYGSIAIIAVIVVHTAARILMADAYTFSPSEYIQFEKQNITEPSGSFETVTYHSDPYNSGYSSPALKNALFITTNPRGISTFNH
ncbi:MAG: hypothetical protein H7Y00_08065 [Fimbriimonadaceae bacterium]|nr:hypothetical protein [Chitinophagales bacterium]